MAAVTFPPFEPHPLLRSGHLQTLAGVYLPVRNCPYHATAHRVTLPDGDTIILHEDRPRDPSPSQPCVLMVHGLAGCHMSSYMRRMARKLPARGFRAFRMDHRNCGAAMGLAARPYHAGRSEDVRAALQWIQRRYPEAPCGVIGFSLSGNIVLKLLGEAPTQVPSNVFCAAAVNPAIDLGRSVDQLITPVQRLYHRHFVKLLRQQIRQAASLQGLGSDFRGLRVSCLRDFDDSFTAPVSGFSGADDYYERCSSKQFLSRIRIPTLILASQNDPLIPVQMFHDLDLSDRVHLHIAECGGHLGFVSRGGTDPDPRWMDWRLIEWLEAQRPMALERSAAAGRILIP